MSAGRTLVCFKLRVASTPVPYGRCCVEVVMREFISLYVKCDRLMSQLCRFAVCCVPWCGVVADCVVLLCPCPPFRRPRPPPVESWYQIVEVESGWRQQWQSQHGRHQQSKHCHRPFCARFACCFFFFLRCPRLVVLCVLFFHWLPQILWCSGLANSYELLDILSVRA